MIDPACGSGHFLLGAFARLLKRWRAKEPGTGDRELVNRALASVHGVDLNPYAVAIARFRLLLAAMRECQVTRLEDAPRFAINLVCGDSLLHGSPGTEQRLLGFHELAHVYQSEDLPELQRILKPGTYHAVVANPPYITVKDKALNQAYRDGYPEVCHMKYSLSVPFLQRLFVLACAGGYTGQITSNSFMKREFGKKLIESYLPKIDLTHVIDTAGAYIPGHGTPTVILFGRNRSPVAQTIRAVMGIRGEPSTPEDPAQGLVWSAIMAQIDQPGSQSDFVSVVDSQRELFHKHPWSIGGGGAAELKEQLDQVASIRVGAIAAAVGITAVTGEDELFMQPTNALLRRCVEHQMPLVEGDVVRDWRVDVPMSSVWMYDSNFDLMSLESMPNTEKMFWRFRAAIYWRRRFGTPLVERGLTWYEWQELYKDKLRTPLSIVFGEVATHNHFVLDRGESVFKRTAPVIKLSPKAGKDDHLSLLGVLNSSIACFWLKQVCHNKGSTVDQHGARQRTDPFEDFYAFNATKLQQFPLPEGRPLDLARALDGQALRLAAVSPATVFGSSPGGVSSLRSALAAACQQWQTTRGQMIALQEDLDWECYQLYALLEQDLTPRRQDAKDKQHPLCAFALLRETLPLRPGQRAFEIVMARKMAAGELQTTWFERHGSTPITELPAEWPEDYKRLVQRRIELIETDRNIALIEQPEYKRRWNTEPWESQQQRALKNWLLDRLESYFDFDGRMGESGQQSAVSGQQEKKADSRLLIAESSLVSVARLADVAAKDRDFLQVAELFTGRLDFDVGLLVGELIAAESVPALPVLRYKPSGLDKRRAWERTWDLQRLEDAVDALFDVERLKKRSAVSDQQSAISGLAERCKLNADSSALVLREAANATGYVAEAAGQGLDLTADTILKPVEDAARRAKQAAVGDIPVPPKYSSADFLSSDYWRLRGKLDVPKERWVSFPHCEGEDGTLVIAWAGYDHLQMARAIAERYELAKEQEGRKVVPLLATIGQLIPWLKQWHNELDPAYGARMGDYFENYLAEEAKALGMNVEQVMAWTPPEKPKKAGRQKK